MPIMSIPDFPRLHPSPPSKYHWETIHQTTRIPFPSPPKLNGLTASSNSLGEGENDDIVLLLAVALGIAISKHADSSEVSFDTAPTYSDLAKKTIQLDHFDGEATVGNLIEQCTASHKVQSQTSSARILFKSNVEEQSHKNGAYTNGFEHHVDKNYGSSPYLMTLSCSVKKQPTTEHQDVLVSFTLLFSSSHCLFSQQEAKWFLGHVIHGFSAMGSPLGSLDQGILHEATRKLHSQPASAVSLISDEEQEEILRFASTPRPPHLKSILPYPDSCIFLQDFFLECASLNPSAAAICWQPCSPSEHEGDQDSLEETFSYVQVLCLARYLSSLLPLSKTKDSVGFTPKERIRGEIVAISLPKSPHAFISLLAVLLSGHGYVFLEPSLPRERKLLIVQELGCQTVIAPKFGIERNFGDSCESLWTSDSEEKLAREMGWPEDLLIIDPFEELQQAGFLGPGPSFSPLPTSRWDPATLETPGNPASPSSYAYVVATSGTTGTPKMIPVTHSNVAAFLRNYQGAFGHNDGGRVLGWPSLGFDVSVVTVWDSWAQGTAVCLSPTPVMRASLSQVLIDLRISVAEITPSVVAVLLEEYELEDWKVNLEYVKQINTGGEMVPRNVRDGLLERGVRVCVDYGPSETTVGVITSSFEPTSNKTGLSPLVPIGRPLGTNRVFIVSSTPELLPVPLGCPGELCIVGPQVTDGYLDESLNSSAFVNLGIESPNFSKPRAYRTGDIGRFLGDGQGSIECLGRKDGQVKIHGQRIEIGEIERHLNPRIHPIVNQGIVDKIEANEAPLGLIAFLEFNKTSAVSCGPEVGVVEIEHERFEQIVETIKTALRQWLPTYMVPRYYLPVTSIPRQLSNKVDRKRLLQLARTSDLRSFSRASVPETQVSGEIEQAVQKAWSTTLSIPPNQIGKQDSFVRLGGDSVGLIRTLALLRKNGLHISPSVVAPQSTLEEFVQAIKKQPSSPPATEYTKLSLVNGQTESIVRAITAVHNQISPADVEDVFPTSPAQDSILVPSVESTHYYAQAVYHINSDVPLQDLARSLDQLVSLRQNFRTVFVTLDSQATPLQVVLKSDSHLITTNKCEVIECATSKSMESEIQIFQKKDRQNRVFDWGKTAFQFKIFTSVEGPRKLVWGLHHALSDGWTLELLMDDIEELCAGRAPRARPSFAEVVRWWQRGRDDRATKKYWREYLAKSKPFRWPLKTPDQEDQLTTSAIVVKKWTGPFDNFHRTHGVTPSVLSRVAFAMAVAELSSSSEVLFGVVRHGRNIDVTDCDAIIGPCLSLLPTRVRFHGTRSFAQLLQEESVDDRKAVENQGITLRELSTCSSSDLGGRLFTTLFTYQRFLDHESIAPRPITSPPVSIYMPTNYGLSAEVTPLDDQSLHLACFYDETVATATQVEAIFAKWIEALDIMTSQPDNLIDSYFSHPVHSDSKTNRLSNGEISMGVPKAAASSGLANGELSSLQEMTQRLQDHWGRILRMDPSLIPIDSRFVSVGGDSVSLMRLSTQLKRDGITIPPRVLIRLATIQEQARWLTTSELPERYTQ